MRAKLWITIVFLGSFVAIIHAENLYVAQNGQAPESPYDTWAKAASSIQDAVDAATTNDTVWVGAGRYTAPANATNYGGTNVVFINRPLTLRSSNGVPATTIIDGEGTNRGIAMYYVSSSATNLLVIDGFTVCNCFATNTGGGIMLDPHSVWTNIIRNCIISNNTVAWGFDFSSFWGVDPGYASRGGGIGVFLRIYNPMLIISNCTIIGNQALNGPVGTDRSYGGGISLGYSTGRIVIDNCLIQGNSAYHGGGYGDYATYSTLIRNCVIQDNTATFGGGIFWKSYRDRVRNCLISGNKASEGGGVYINHGYQCKFENCTIVSNTATSASSGGGVTVKYLNSNTKMWMQNSIVMSNGTTANDNLYYNYSIPPPCSATNHIMVSNTCIICTLDLPDSNNIIADSPRFIDFASQNFRLAPDSPCVNTGTNQSWMTNGVDLDGRKRLRYGTVDIGAYELIYDGTIYKFH